jgi:hypothetical protein
MQKFDSLSLRLLAHQVITKLVAHPSLVRLLHVFRYVTTGSENGHKDNRFGASVVGQSNAD